MRATRFDPVVRGDQHLSVFASSKAAVAAGLLRHHGFSRQRTGHEHGLARVRVAFGTAGDAAAVVAEVEDVEPERRQVESGHGEECCGWPAIVAESNFSSPFAKRGRWEGARSAKTSQPPLRLWRKGEFGHFCFNSRPTGTTSRERALATHCLANTSRIWLSPFGMVVRHRDLAVHRLAVAVVVGDRGVHRHPVLEFEPDASRTVIRPSEVKPSAPGIEARAQGGIEPRFHPRLDRLDRRGLDGDVGAACARASPMPISASGSKSKRMAMPPPLSLASALARRRLRLVDHLLTNSLAAALASAAGK